MKMKAVLLFLAILSLAFSAAGSTIDLNSGSSTFGNGLTFYTQNGAGNIATVTFNPVSYSGLTVPGPLASGLGSITVSAVNAGNSIGPQTLSLVLSETSPVSDSGTIFGSISAGSVSNTFGSNLQATFGGPVTFQGITYTYTGPATLNLAIGTTVIPGTATAALAATPEPSTWVLALVAIPVIGIGRRFPSRRV